MIIMIEQLRSFGQQRAKRRNRARIAGDAASSRGPLLLPLPFDLSAEQIRHQALASELLLTRRQHPPHVCLVLLLQHVQRRHRLGQRLRGQHLLGGLSGPSEEPFHIPHLLPLKLLLLLEDRWLGRRRRRTLGWC